MELGTWFNMAQAVEPAMGKQHLSPAPAERPVEEAGPSAQRPPNTGSRLLYESCAVSASLKWGCGKDKFTHQSHPHSPSLDSTSDSTSRAQPWPSLPLPGRVAVENLQIIEDPGGSAVHLLKLPGQVWLLSTRICTACWIGLPPPTSRPPQELTLSQLCSHQPARDPSPA